MDLVSGTASRVRHTLSRTEAPVALGYGDWGETRIEHVALLSVDGVAVEVRSTRPIHLGDGDRVDCVGSWGRDGTLRAVVLRNATQGLTVGETALEQARLVGLLACVVGVALPVGFWLWLGRLMPGELAATLAGVGLCVWVAGFICFLRGGTRLASVRRLLSEARRQ